MVHSINGAYSGRGSHEFFAIRLRADYLGLPKDHPLGFGIGFNAPAHPTVGWRTHQ
jgi:hypothetical protein